MRTVQNTAHHPGSYLSHVAHRRFREAQNYLWWTSFVIMWGCRMAKGIRRRWKLARIGIGEGRRWQTGIICRPRRKVACRIRREIR